MKHYMGLLMFIIVSSHELRSAQFSSYEKPEDYSIVNAIIRESNLTQSEVNKFKLVGLGRLQDAVAATVGGYSAYKGATKAYELGTKAENLSKSTFLEPYVSEGILSVLADKRVWALAGAFGVGYGAYKILYPRLESGIFEQVKTFVEMCENLDVYNYTFTGQYVSYLPQMGSIGKRNDGRPYMSQWLGVNAAWASSNIARQKGIENLLSQANMATQLLSQIENTEEVQNLRGRIGTIIQHVTNNKSIVEMFAANEMQQRMQSHAAQIHGAQQVAQLNLTQQQASALWYGKISLAATALSNFAKNSLQTLVYINDNKQQIISGAVISAAALYGTFAWLKAKIAGN